MDSGKQKGNTAHKKGKAQRGRVTCKFCKKWWDTGQTQPCSVCRSPALPTAALLSLSDPVTAACSWCSFPLSAGGQGWSWRESIKCHGNLTRSRTSGSCQIPCPLLGCSLIEDEQKPKAGKCLPESILICPPHSTPFLQLLLEPALPKACCGTGVCCSG